MRMLQVFFCKIKSVERWRFMASSLKKLVNSLAEGIYKIKSKDRTCFLEYKRVNENWIKYKFLSCNKNHSNKNDEKFIKRFKNTFKFLIAILTNLFCCWEKVFILMNIWMSGKGLMKHHCLKKTIFSAT